MNIQQKVKINKLKKKIFKNMYKPFAIIDKYVDSIKETKDKKLREKALNMNINEVANRTVNVIMKQLVKYSLMNNYEIELQVASWSDSNYCIKTILQYQQQQNKDKQLAIYACNIKNDDYLEYNQKMCRLISQLLIKNNCNVNYEVFQHYNYKNKDYIKSMFISIK